jgi:hypothetical protein
MLVNVFFIWNMIHIRVPLICFKSYQPYAVQLTRMYSVTFFFLFINMVIILRTWRVEKSLLEINLFNVWTVFVGVQKMHFFELKMRFLPNAPIHILWYKRNIFDCLDVSKCVFYLKYDLHSCSSDLFQKLSSPVCRATYSSVVEYMLVFCLIY